MVCNPNNPTGHVLSEHEMDEIVRAADRVGAWIVADEIYRGAELDTDVDSPTFFGRYDRVIVTSGLSKAFAMPGLRVGWVVAPHETIERIWERHDYTTLTPSIVGDRLAALAMQPDVREAHPHPHALDRQDELPQARGVAPQHTTTSCAGCGQPPARSRTPQSSCPSRASSSSSASARERSVLLVPGDMFGLGKGLRFGFGFDIDHTMKGLSLVDDVLAEVAVGR